MWNMKIRYLCHKVVTDQICGLEVTGLIPVNSYIFLFSYFGVDVDMNKTWTSICRMFFHMNMINIILCLKIANILQYWVFSHKKYLYVTLHPSISLLKYIFLCISHLICCVIQHTIWLVMIHLTLLFWQKP